MRIRQAAGFRVRSSSWRFAMASSAASIAMTTGSGALGCGSVLGVNSGRGSGRGVLSMCLFNSKGWTVVPGDIHIPAVSLINASAGRI
jgi:hypothetical protein